MAISSFYSRDVYCPCGKWFTARDPNSKACASCRNKAANLKNTSNQMTNTPARIVSWYVATQQRPFGPEEKRLRVYATYSDGSARIVRAAFADRVQLDKYLNRFHFDYLGKEIDPPPSEPTQP